MNEPRRKLSIQVPELPWLKKAPVARSRGFSAADAFNGEEEDLEIAKACKPAGLRGIAAAERSAWEEACETAMKQAAQKKPPWAGTD